MVAACAVAHAGLDPNRVHLVDHNPGSGNFLFRGNMPTNDTGFAYDQLFGLMAERAGNASLTLPANAYMHVISLNNIADGKDFSHEKAWWKQSSSAQLGELTLWPLGLAGILPPKSFSDGEKKRQMASENASNSVWKVDNIPSHVRTLNVLMEQQGPSARPRIIYVHCTAGCDRTGELIGAYRLTNGLDGHNIVDTYAHDACEPAPAGKYGDGRFPNYYSTSALSWYCLYDAYYGRPNASALAGCETFYSCKPLGDCHPAS